MPLSDAEILELESLLQDRERDNLFKGLTNLSDKTNPNYRFLNESILNQVWGLDEKKRPVLISGNSGCVLEGSSRSGKTWSGVDIIIWLCTKHHPGCKINIYREFFAEFADSLYDDFKRRLDDFGLPNKFHNAEIVKSFKINGSKISFIGCDKAGGKHGAGCDYAFFNETMHINNLIFDHVEMRCRKFWWMDYNPSFTDHWVFDKVITRSDVGFLRTTFLENNHISGPERNKILSYEPWEPDSYQVIDNEIFYNWEPVTENNQPPPNQKNIDQGTADEFMWRVYGLGLRGAMEGVIFKYVEYIDEFPDIAYTYGMDFGFTADPTALVRHAETKHDIFLELLIYQPTETPEEIHEAMKALNIERNIPITADSADRYVSEKKGAVKMVSSLRQKGWQITKVRKTKNIMYWLGSMKKKKIHIVKNRLQGKFKKEFENYKLKEVNGIKINQPIDGFDHGISAGRYSHMAHNDYKGITREWV